jgi:hypothetical protein
MNEEQLWGRPGATDDLTWELTDRGSDHRTKGTMAFRPAG